MARSCHKITEFYPTMDLKQLTSIHFQMCEKAYVNMSDLYNYANGKILYSWHISDLVIYDKPKELSEFITICPEWEKEYLDTKCLRCKYYFSNCADMRHECTVEGEKPLTKPPQSWCYVKEREYV